MTDPKKIEKPILDEIATCRNDPDIFAGWLTRLENPDPVLITESGGQGIRLYDEVARDPHAGSVLQTRYLAVAGKEWEVLPASDSPADAKIAAFVEAAVGAVNATQAIAELMQAVLFGHYEAEVMWRVKDGNVVPARIVGKHPRRFCFDLDRRLRMLTPESLFEGKTVPGRKFIVFTFGSSDNPYGDGLGKKLWWPVWFKKNGIKFWLIFLEKFGMPTTVGKYPSGTHPDQQRALMDALTALQSDSGVKIPDSMAIELLEATRGGNVTYETLCDYMDRQISKAVLGQTLTTEVKGEGSYAASRTHNDVREDILKADADLLCECLNASLIKWIVDYNFPPPAEYPRLWLRVEAEQDLRELSERDRTLVRDIGVPVGRQYFYDTYNLPEPGPGEDLVAVPASAGNFSEAAADVTPVTPLADAMAEQTAPAWKDVIARVQRIVDAAPDLPTLRDRLLGAYAGLPEKDLAEVMAMGFAAADLAGRYDIQQERADA